jgi:hypothetical protein
VDQGSGESNHALTFGIGLIGWYLKFSELQQISGAEELDPRDKSRMIALTHMPAGWVP